MLVRVYKEISERKIIVTNMLRKPSLKRVRKIYYKKHVKAQIGMESWKTHYNDFEEEDKTQLINEKGEEIIQPLRYLWNFVRRYCF